MTDPLLPWLLAHTTLYFHIISFIIIKICLYTIVFGMKKTANNTGQTEMAYLLPN